MSSRSFRTIPAGAERIWSLRDISVTAEPTSNKAMDVTYQSPIREIKLTTKFINESTLNALPYMMDDDSFVDEWDFANEAWDDMISAVTDAITAYNKTVIKRTKDLGLKSVSVVGRATTTYEPAAPLPSVAPVHPYDAERMRVNKVETTYEPTIRSTVTRRSSQVKLTPIQAWLGGRRLN